MLILTVNAGSSSLKFAIHRLVDGQPQCCELGRIEAIGEAPRCLLRDAQGAMQALPVQIERGHAAALEWLLGWLPQRLAGERLLAIGHRVVHGGPRHAAPVAITPQLLGELEALSDLAPLHQPHNLAPIRHLLKAHPELLQVACFDTAFHHDLPPLAQRYGLPTALHQAGVRRYGFHGLSYEYLAERLAQVDPPAAAGRSVILHLGNGASLCALAAGRSVHTSMGFSALEGLLMGTRCGSLDPGVVLHLIRQGMNADELESLLYRQCGLLGVSGIAADMRTLLASNEAAAATAVALYCHRACLEIAAAVAALHAFAPQPDAAVAGAAPLDALVFSAGIGENAAAVRAAIVAGCGWLGLKLDAPANDAGQLLISSADSSARIWVLPTDEEGMIARHVWRIHQQRMTEHSEGERR